MSNNNTKHKVDIYSSYEVISSLMDIVLYNYYNNTNPDYKHIRIMLLGLPGCGKSYGIKHYCKKHDLPVMTFIASQIPFNDLTGLDYPNANENGVIQLSHVNPDWINRLLKLSQENELVVLFLDELNTTDRETKKLLLDFLLSRKLRGMDIPDNIIIVGAGNYDDIYADAAMYNRFVVCSLDRTDEGLPYVTLKDPEVEAIVDGCFESVFPSLKIEKKFDIFNTEFSKTSVKEDSLEDFYKIIRSVMLKANALNKFNSPQDLVLDDKRNGVQGLLPSARMMMTICYFLIAAHFTGRFYSIIKRFAADNLGKEVEGKFIFNDLSAIPTVTDGSGIMYKTIEDLMNDYPSEETTTLTVEEVTMLCPSIVTFLNDQKNGQDNFEKLKNHIGQICYLAGLTQDKLTQKQIAAFNSVMCHEIVYNSNYYDTTDPAYKIIFDYQ